MSIFKKVIIYDRFLLVPPSSILECPPSAGSQDDPKYLWRLRHPRTLPGRRCLWTLASLFTLLRLAPGLSTGPYSVWRAGSERLINQNVTLACTRLIALVSVWLPSNLTKCYLSYLYASIDTFLCISGNNLLCPMSFVSKKLYTYIKFQDMAHGSNERRHSYLKPNKILH